MSKSLSESGKIMAGIGHVCVAWSALETAFLFTIFHLTDLDNRTGMIAFGGLDMLPRANMAINLARHKNVARPQIRQLEAARKAIQQTFSDGRNRAVHATHLGSELLPDAQRVLMVRWKGQKQESVMTADELEILAVSIEEQTREVLDVLFHLATRKGSVHKSKDVNSDI